MNDQEIIEALNRAAREPPGPPRAVTKEDFDAIRKLVEQQPRIAEPRLVTMSDLIEKDQAFNFDPKENPPLTDEEVIALYRYYRGMADLLTWEPNMTIATDYTVRRAQNFIEIVRARGLSVPEAGAEVHRLKRALADQVDEIQRLKLALANLVDDDRLPEDVQHFCCGVIQGWAGLTEEAKAKAAAAFPEDI